MVLFFMKDDYDAVSAEKGAWLHLLCDWFKAVCSQAAFDRHAAVRGTQQPLTTKFEWLLASCLRYATVELMARM
jgi:hypothetical protein